MNMRSFWAGLAAGTILTCLIGQWVLAASSKEADPIECISAERVANYVHSVIQADRTIYTVEIVERMQMRGIVTAAENWRENWKLPLPAQFLIEAGRLAAQEPNGVQFRLISNWAINKKNRPTTEFERMGLTEILVDPSRPHTGVVTEGRVRSFQALYPDRAVSQTCIGCHNAHPNSPKTDFKLQDVMGGVLLTIPLAQ